MAGNIAPRPCPKCGGQMWNNVGNKRNPKAPDFACKNKQGCGEGIWLSDTEKNALQAQAVPAAASTAAGAPARAHPLILDSLMNSCLEAAVGIAKKNFPDGCEREIVQAIAVTMYISRCRGEGILKAEKPKAAAKDAHAAEPPSSVSAGNGSAPPAPQQHEPSTPPRSLDEEGCPKCGGRMWDNRLTKRNPSAPDFKCRDRSCDGVIWPPRAGEQRAPAMAAAGAPETSWAPLPGAPFIPDDADLPF